MRLPLKILAGILAFTSVVLMAVITLPYLSLRHDINFLLTKQSVLHIISWRYSFYIHIVSSFFVLLAGSIQMLFKLTPELHRKLGATYVLLILIFAAPSGLIMSFYSNGGIIASISFSLLSILWWVFTWRAWRSAKTKDYNSHRSAMIRSFALTLAAITLRTYVLLLPIVLNLSAKDAYTLVSVLSWVPNLLVAETVIRYSNFLKDPIKVPLSE